jgi:predicted  nucleic acid-binding Zn ribbon protein
MNNSIKKYIIEVSIESVEANNIEEAYKKAYELIKQDKFNLQVVGKKFE